MDGGSRIDHQGEPGYIGAVTRISGVAEAKTSAAGERGEQDKVVMMSQDTPTEEAQSPAALAAPVGAAQQPPDRKDGEEMSAQQLELSKLDQAGAPVLQREDVMDSLRLETLRPLACQDPGWMSCMRGSDLDWKRDTGRGKSSRRWMCPGQDT